MKKAYLLAFAMSGLLLLSGCGNNPESQATKSLSSQLAHIEEVVGSTNSNEVASVSPNISFDGNTIPSSIQHLKASAYQNMNKEENIRQDILGISSTLKNCLSKPLKLSSGKASSLIELCNNLDSYAKKLSETKNAIKSTVKRINKNLKNTDKQNLPEAESCYITLGNNMNERYAYMSNIYSNLEQIYNIIDCCPSCSQNTENLNNSADTQANTSGCNVDTFKNEKQQTNINGVAQNNTAIVQPQQREPFMYYPNDYYCNNCYRGQFNPNRNTDSFYPKMKNIDTYRALPNDFLYNGDYYNPPMQFYSQPII